MASSMTSAAEERAAVVDGWAIPRLDAAYPDEECGCPVEEWMFGGINLTLHFEPDRTLELFADAGEWDRTVTLKAATMEAARDEAFSWVRDLPTEEDITIERGAHLAAPKEGK